MRNQQKQQRIINRQERRNRRRIGFEYSFFTIVLIFCFLQIGYGAILNVSKIISYQGKMVTLENLLKKAQMRNEDLKTEKKVVTSDNSLEGIARNNLKMAGEDEILVIINEKPEEVKTEKKKKHFEFLEKFKKDKKPEADVKKGTLDVPTEVVEE